MLTKSICQNCITTESNKAVRQFDHHDDMPPWTERDDNRWDRGLVYCPFVDGQAKTDGPVPHWCPYAAEQVVSGQNGLVKTDT